MPEIRINRRYYESGQLKSEVPYKNTQIHGIQRKWYKNGQLHYKTSFQNNQFHGTREWWDRDGRQVFKEHWLYGEEVSKEEYKKHKLIEKLSCLK